MPLNGKELVGHAKSVADKGKAQSAILGVLFIGLTILEEIYVEEIFTCGCYDTCGPSNGISAAFIIISTLMIYLLSFGLMQASGVKVSCGKKIGKYEETKPGPSKGNPQGQENEACDSSARNSVTGTPKASASNQQESSRKCYAYIYHGFKYERVCKSLKMSLIAVLGWLIVLLIDGDYWACLCTCKPYGDFDCRNFTVSDRPPYSKNYEDVKLACQLVGIGIIFVGVLLLAIIGAIYFKTKSGCGCKCTYTDKLYDGGKELDPGGKKSVDGGKETGEVLQKLAPNVQQTAVDGLAHATTTLTA